jgi:hypothetical protein
VGAKNKIPRADKLLLYRETKVSLLWQGEVNKGNRWCGWVECCEWKVRLGVYTWARKRDITCERASPWTGAHEVNTTQAASSLGFQIY